MSSNLPLRAIRTPSLRKQCLFQQHRRHCQPLRAFSATAPQLFALTSPRAKATVRQDRALTEANAKLQSKPAPRVGLEDARREAGGTMTEDIGLLQNTIVRTSLSKLPSVLTLPFWRYHWKLMGSKLSGLYSRSSYKRCEMKTTIWRFLPIDAFKGNKLKGSAKKLYETIYKAFAEGDTETIGRFCLPPLARDFEDRIAARGPLRMKWTLDKFHSARIVSHRAAMVGEDQPDSAYRQVTLRLESTQTATWTRDKTKTSGLPTNSDILARRRSKWVPEQAKGVARDDEEESERFVDNGVPKKVVEHMVLQRRVVNGQEEDEWRVWGFTQASTPESLAEDEVYWQKTLESAQGASA